MGYEVIAYLNPERNHLDLSLLCINIIHDLESTSRLLIDFEVTWAKIDIQSPKDLNMYNSLQF